MSSNIIRRTRMLAACAGIAAVVGIAGCSTSNSASDNASGKASSSSTESGSSTSSQSASADSTTHNAADVTFNQMMIPHHRQAIAMADLVPSRTENTAVRELATQIKNAQQPEIDQMTQRLTSWGVSTTPASQGAKDPSSMDHGSMDHGSADHGSMGMDNGAGNMGMMSAQEMTAMENARGKEFDTLWLKGMIAHHQGAIDMAKTELANGIDPASRALAEQITTSQQAEIDRMRSMLGQ